MTLVALANRSHRSPFRLLGLLLAASVLSAGAMAQEAEGQGADEGAAPAAGGEAAPQEAKVIPTIRTAVFEILDAAQICMEEGDFECVNQQLTRWERMRDLNNYEQAQLLNFRAFFAFEQDDPAAAVEAYEQLLAIPHEDMPDGLIQQATRNLATLYLQEERWEEGLATFQDYMALPTVTPNAADYYLLGTIYYQMERYADVIEPIEEAIRLANERGEIGEEQWYQLLYASHFQLENTEAVIETLTFMVEHWTKRQWVLALAQHLSTQERELETLTLYEAAYEAGFLTRGSELVQLANMYMQHEAFYQGAVLLQQGLDDGTIESNELNWRTLAQAWQLAREDEKALPAFERAAMLADDGNVDRLRTQSLVRLARWEECVEAARAALDKGGLDRTDVTYMYLGQCLFNLKRFDEARTAFQEAARDDRSARQARDWVTYVNTQVERERSNEEALENIARLEAANR